MLGVTVLIIVLSVMNGFGHEIRSKIVDTQGHLRVQSSGFISEWEALSEKLLSRDEVAGVAPFAHGPVMLQFRNQPRFPVMQGIDVEREATVVELSKFIQSGSIDDLDDDSVLLSSSLALGLRAGVGSEVEVYSPLLLDKLTQDEILLPRSVQVVGIYETGWSQIDDNTVICSLALMQDLYGLSESVHGLKIRLRSGVDVYSVTPDLADLLGPSYSVLSWLESNRDFLFVIQMEKNILFFLLLFIILVSAFAITSSLLITVVRKMREIGLLGALGGRPWQIGMCFCVQGFFIGVVGTGLGVGLAFLALHFRNDIVHAFARWTQSEAALLRFYQFSDLPSDTSIQDLVIIGAASIIISTFAGLIPAWRAAKLRPAEALRSE